MSLTRLLIGAWLSALVAAGCGERGAAVPRACVATRARGLTGASASPPAGLALNQQAAIGVLTTADGETVCTGTMVGEGYVLTAAHCVHQELSQALLFGTSDRANDLELLVSSYWLHPTLDAMLLALPIARDAFPGWIEPMPVVTDAQRRWTGTRLWLAGFGDDENGVDGVRRYVPEPVVEEDASWLVVDGGTTSGACAKDSGGPLVTVAAGGAASVVGLLSAGSATCRGEDRYLRVSFGGHVQFEANCNTLVAGSTCREAGPAIECAAPHPHPDCTDSSDFGSWCEGGVAMTCLSGVRVQAACDALPRGRCEPIAGTNAVAKARCVVDGWLR